MLFALGSNIPSAIQLHVLGLIFAITLMSNAVASQYEFDACELPNRGTGICRVFEECQELVDKLKRHEITINDPARCGFKGAKELICCPGSGGNIGSRDGKPAFEENQEVTAVTTKNPIDKSSRTQSTTAKPDFWLPLLGSSSTTTSTTTTAKPDFWLHLLNSTATTTTTTPKPLVIDGKELDNNAELYDFSKLLGQKKESESHLQNGVQNTFNTQSNLVENGRDNWGNNGLVGESQSESLNGAESGLVIGNLGNQGIDSGMVNKPVSGFNNGPMNMPGSGFTNGPVNVPGAGFGNGVFNRPSPGFGNRPVNVPGHGVTNGPFNVPGAVLGNGAVNRPGSGFNNEQLNVPGQVFTHGQANVPGAGFGSGVVNRPGSGFHNAPVNIPASNFNNPPQNGPGFGLGNRRGASQRNAFGLNGMHSGQRHGHGHGRRSEFQMQPDQFHDRPITEDGPIPFFRPDQAQQHFQKLPQVNVGMRTNILARPSMPQGFAGHYGRGQGRGHGRGHQFQNRHVNNLGPHQSPPLSHPQQPFQFQDPPIEDEEPPRNPFLPSVIPTVDHNEIEESASNNIGLPHGQIWQEQNRNEYENRNENENEYQNENHIHNGDHNGDQNENTFYYPPKDGDFSDAEMQQNLYNNIRDIFTTDFQSPSIVQELPESAIRMNEENVEQWSIRPSRGQRFMQA